jgi:hypothetical protein
MEPDQLHTTLNSMQPNTTITTLGSLLAPSLDLAGLLVELPTSHLLLQSASLYQLAEPAYRILYRLSIADLQLNHASLSNQTFLRSLRFAKLLVPRNVLQMNSEPPRQFPRLATPLYRQFRGQNCSLSHTICLVEAKGLRRKA